MSTETVAESMLFSAGSNRRFEFHKRCQLSIRVHNEALPVAAMRVCNPDPSNFVTKTSLVSA